MGDLNFRVDLPDGEVRKLVENKDWAGMLVRDQVRFFFPIFLLYLSTPPQPVIGLFFSFCRWKENVVWNSGKRRLELI